MSELYLIAHLVRGEPAFDIASQIESDGETIWIIPTSGHRAWPYWYIDLDELMPTDLINADECGRFELTVGEAMKKGRLPPPPNHPDHYSTTAAKGRGTITNLASLLGIKREEVKRRV